MTKNELKLKISQTAQKLEIRENLVLRFLILISSKIKRTSKEIIREIGLPQVHSYRLIHEFTDILETKSKFIEVKTAIFKEFNNFLSEICMETNINSKKK